MRRLLLGLFVPAMMVGLSGCSWLSVLGADEDKAVQAAPADPNAGLAEKVSVARIDTLELGRLYDGYMLTAHATAAGIGYYQPELRPRFGGRAGPDGFLEYDFVVRAPETQISAPDAPTTARRIRADSELTPVMLRSARGVRVWAERGSVEGRF